MPNDDDRIAMTVGEIRTALDGVPDDRLLYFQVAGKDGSAWNLCPRITPLVSERAGFGVVTLSHPDLKSLPEMGGDDD